ncbi:MAG: DUF5103 domain-containing protein [Bacteroidetes bacterium]|nr:DUF5103 domain-containing protein [Bacteroidota bacterium]
MKLLLLFILFISLSQVINGQVLEDKVFVDHILSVRMFPQGSGTENQLLSPVISLTDSKSLVVLFDDLSYDPELYTAKLVHCDADWKKSALKDTDFSLAFNEYNVMDYAYSVNTRMPYIRYSFTLPRVSKSGNYLLKVYKNRDENAVIFTRRFMIVENLAAVGAQLVPPVQTEDRRALQQINATVNYSKLEVIDPLAQVKVYMRQNQRWDNVKILTKPTFLNQNSKLIRYEPFEGESTFRAGNEFRFIDLRFIRATGVNIASVKVEESLISAEVRVDLPRPGGVYAQYLDLNGQYMIQTSDRPGGDPEVESEYIYTTFYLNDVPGKTIKLIGALSQWGKALEATLVYDAKKRIYTTSLLLKQGWYDYHYASDRGDGLFDSESLEGSHFQTENEYEVLVYYRALGSRYDQLVGYVYLQPNKRRL